MLLAACGGERPGKPVGDAEAPTTVTAPPADSLALSIGGVEVWYTLARPGRSASGEPCVDRALEIRRGESRIPVPLLYTGTPPEPVDDTTFRARLSDRCAPGASYLVSLRTGRPTPER
jgi:hypothetical protein